MRVLLTVSFVVFFNWNTLDLREQDGLITLDTLSFDKESMKTDAVVVAIGIDPRTELAQDAGLEIDPTNGGIVVRQKIHIPSKPVAFAFCLESRKKKRQKLRRRRNTANGQNMKKHIDPREEKGEEGMG